MNSYQTIRQLLTQMQERGDVARHHYLQKNLPNQQLPGSVQQALLAGRFNHAALSILTVLATGPVQGMAYQDLVNAVPFSQGLVSRYVNRLAKAGLVTKTHPAGNRKTVWLTISAVGTRVNHLHLAMHQAEDQAANAVLAALPPEAVNATIKVLTALVDPDQPD